MPVIDRCYYSIDTQAVDGGYIAYGMAKTVDGR